MRVYNAIVTPTLLYGSETWTRLAADMKKLEVVQRRCLRKLLGLRMIDKVENETIYALYCDQIIESNIREHRRRWMGHVCRMNDERLPKRLRLDERPANWKCPRKAPRKQWKDQVLADLKPLHFVVELERYN